MTHGTDLESGSTATDTLALYWKVYRALTSKSSATSVPANTPEAEAPLPEAVKTSMWGLMPPIYKLLSKSPYPTTETHKQILSVITSLLEAMEKSLLIESKSEAYSPFMEKLNRLNSPVSLEQPETAAVLQQLRLESNGKSFYDVLMEAHERLHSAGISPLHNRSTTTYVYDLYQEVHQACIAKQAAESASTHTPGAEDLLCKAVETSIWNLIPSIDEILYKSTNNQSLLSSILGYPTVTNEQALGAITTLLEAMKKSLLGDGEARLLFMKMLNELSDPDSPTQTITVTVLQTLQLKNGKYLYDVLMEARQTLQLKKVSLLCHTVRDESAKARAEINKEPQIYDLAPYPLCGDSNTARQLYADTLTSIQSLIPSFDEALQNNGQALRHSTGSFLNFFGEAPATVRESLNSITDILESMEAALNPETFFHLLRQLDALYFAEEKKHVVVLKQLRLKDGESLYHQLITARGTLLSEYKKSLFPSAEGPVSLAGLWVELGNHFSEKNNLQPSVETQKGLSHTQQPEPSPAETQLVTAVLQLLTNFSHSLDDYHQQKKAQQLSFLEMMLAQMGLSDSDERIRQAQDLSKILAQTQKDYQLVPLLNTLASYTRKITAQSRLHTQSAALLDDLAKFAKKSNPSSMPQEGVVQLQYSMSQYDPLDSNRQSATQAKQDPVETEPNSWASNLFLLGMLFTWFKWLSGTTKQAEQHPSTKKGLPDEEQYMLVTGTGSLWPTALPSELASDTKAATDSSPS